jgi:hypothetical protein
MSHDRTGHVRAACARLAVVALALVAACTPSEPSATGAPTIEVVVPTSPTTSAARPTLPASDSLVVSADAMVRPLNRDLVGFHGRDDAATIAAGDPGLTPTSFRHVMSDYDLVDFDCATGEISPATIEYFGSWIDAVDARGARPILSLSYVPPCFARDGQPKGPPNPGDVAAYRQFLDDLLTALVTDRAAAGKEPMRWFELWNEPDVPIEAGSASSGHGYVGTLEEYVALNLPSLVGAILAVEADSGVDVQVGTPAAFAPWSFGSVYGDMATLLEQANGFDRATAESLAAQADTAFGPGTTDRVLANGGTTWPRRVVDEAAALGLDVDVASVHMYPNNPMQGVRFPEPDAPEPLVGRNPDASPNDFATLAERWSAEFGDLELVVSEWALSAGVDDRFGTCEAAAFDAAALSVMQEVAIDRALFLGRPRGVEDAPLRAWSTLPANQVRAALPVGLDDVWVTAATGDGRTTVLVSQWHSQLDDAADLRLPVVVEGLSDGRYAVTIEVIGHGSSPAAAITTTEVDAVDGRIDLGEPLSLRGQALARIDVRSAGIDALPPFTAADPTGPAHNCLL